MNMNASANGSSFQFEHKLSFDEIVQGLQQQQILSDAKLETLKQKHFLSLSGVNVHPLVWIGEQGLVSEQGKKLDLTRLTEWLADWVGMPYFHIDPLKIDVEKVTSVVSQAYASRFGILPVATDGETVTFATAEPFLREWKQEIARILKREIHVVLSNPLQVARYSNEFFTLSKSIQKAGKQGRLDDSVNNVEALVELGQSGKLDANDQHVVSIVDWLLQYAFDQRASDIHLEPRRDTANVRFRIDGMLHTVYEMPTAILVAVVSRIKTLGRMDIVERRRPQDGRVKTKTPSGDEVELRLSTMPTAFGEKMVMRIFDPQVLVKDFSQLGFSRTDRKNWDSLIAKTHGIVLVTGPTGSGKTTTLYSTLKKLAQPEINLCTIEDPIEMVEPSLNQMQVNPGIGVDFATGVKTLLRQDPDIIMIGEIRDLDTANMAIQAALTGHLVLSTLHTNDASAAITRLQDLGVPSYLINATLLGVAAQRLVRTLCPHCKKEIDINEKDWKQLVKPWLIEMPEKSWEAVGCHECRQTGYAGRVGVYEMMTMTPEIRALVNDETTIEAVRKQAVKQGTEALRISGARKVRKGLTSLSEVLRVVPSIDTL